MFELWIPITIAAAFFQNLRFVLQKHIKGELSTLATTFARFVWAAPIAALALLALCVLRGEAPPEMTARFAGFAVLGGAAQILATNCLVALFALRNFAAGVAFSKTEVAQTALFALVLLGEAATGWALAAIAVSFVGVLLVSAQPGALFQGGLFSRAAALGLGSGALFGISAVSYRAASLSLGSGDFLVRALMTLAVVTALQTIAMWVWMARAEPGSVRAVFARWRITFWIGITGGLGSFGWFAAMTLQNAAYVRALGQIELVFTFIAGVFFFRETSPPREVLGILLIVGGILILLLGA